MPPTSARTVRRATGAAEVLWRVGPSASRACTPTLTLRRTQRLAEGGWLHPAGDGGLEIRGVGIRYGA